MPAHLSTSIMPCSALTLLHCKNSDQQTPPSPILQWSRHTIKEPTTSCSKSTNIIHSPPPRRRRPPHVLQLMQKRRHAFNYPSDFKRHHTQSLTSSNIGQTYPWTTASLHLILSVSMIVKMTKISCLPCHPTPWILMKSLLSTMSNSKHNQKQNSNSLSIEDDDPEYFLHWILFILFSEGTIQSIRIVHRRRRSNNFLIPSHGASHTPSYQFPRQLVIAEDISLVGSILRFAPQRSASRPVYSRSITPRLSAPNETQWHGLAHWSPLVLT